MQAEQTELLQDASQGQMASALSPNAWATTTTEVHRGSSPIPRPWSAA